MADTNLSTPKPARKPKPKVRALKEHKPYMRIDVEKAESLLKDLRRIAENFNRKMIDFQDVLHGPIWNAATKGESINSDLGEILGALRGYISDYTMQTVRGEDRAIEAMKGAVAAFRLLRTMREKNTTLEVDV